MHTLVDRRRYHRFDSDAVQVNIATIRRGDNSIELVDCRLTNICYGGMCLSTTWPLERDKDYEFLVDLRSPIDDWVLVKAHICWTRQLDDSHQAAGAAFIESSKGWLGQEDPPAVSREREPAHTCGAALCTTYLV
jgi:hypothetical protein